jgi:transcriptional regulator NrdR family protein
MTTIKQARLMMKILGFTCPKCKSENTKATDSMTTNMDFTTAENRKCNKCGHEWVRYYQGR